MKTLSLSLSDDSLKRAIGEVKNYRRSLDQKGRMLAKRLAEIGCKVARIRFTNAAYDGMNDVTVSVEETKNGYVIVAKGESVAFIEFGTGVYNPEHPMGAELGMIHGTYGQGKGKRKAWGYYDDAGQLHITRGNSPAMAMYAADREILQQVSRIAKEVFASD